jgi:hypothetical protein
VNALVSPPLFDRLVYDNLELCGVLAVETLERDVDRFRQALVVELGFREHLDQLCVFGGKQALDFLPVDRGRIRPP